MAMPPTLGTIFTCDDRSLGWSTKPNLKPKSMKTLEKSITAAMKGGTYGKSAELMIGYVGWLYQKYAILAVYLDN